MKARCGSKDRAPRRQRLELERFKHKPFALVYEEILLAEGPASRVDEETMKKRIAKLIGGLQFNEIHQRVMAPGVNHILTTNYDYGFEIASGQDNIRATSCPRANTASFGDALLALKIIVAGHAIRATWINCLI